MNTFLDNFLSDQEKDLLKQFADNEPMKEAVRKVLLASVYYNGVISEGKILDPLTNWAMVLAKGQYKYTNEQLGAQVRATAEGISVVESAYHEIDKFKTEKVAETNEENQAR